MNDVAAVAIGRSLRKSCNLFEEESFFSVRQKWHTRHSWSENNAIDSWRRKVWRDVWSDTWSEWCQRKSLKYWSSWIKIIIYLIDVFTNKWKRDLITTTDDDVYWCCTCHATQHFLPAKHGSSQIKIEKVFWEMKKTSKGGNFAFCHH